MKKSLLLMLFLSVFAIASTAPVHAADLSHKDKGFVMKAASGGVMEVDLGQLAQQRGQSQDVKDFGSRMVADHTKANDELKMLAQQKNINLPAKSAHEEK